VILQIWVEEEGTGLAGQGYNLLVCSLRNLKEKLNSQGKTEEKHIFFLQDIVLTVCFSSFEC